ncbi:hypothetical protein GPZ80_29680 [Actinokineospora sp. HBU206404]|uniref:Uncharacterized protein n=1 Tax=Actinokineospora xionganensis TaxID=2684470 RepID=A0ABR7LFG6_9PSEU|nr:hypothetical protein [Actinokineospora xionganensis]MBC6451338.1 hypothetical protein [Actinokineospora xionganensis]
MVRLVLVATGDFECSGQASASCVEVDDGLLDRRHAVCPRLLGLRVEVAQGGGEQVVPVSAEDVVAEEVVEAVKECGFAHPETVRVPVGNVTGLGCAGVVGGSVAGLTEHAAAAEFAEQVGAQPVGAFGRRVRVGPGPGARALAAADDLLGGDEGVQVNDLVVGGVAGPHPLLDRVRTAVAGLHRASVPHHVAGVLGLGQDLADTAAGPATDRPLRIHRSGRRVGDQISVQPYRDRFVAESFGDPQLVDGADHRRFGGVRDQDGLRPWTDATLAPVV